MQYLLKSVILPECDTLDIPWFFALSANVLDIIYETQIMGSLVTSEYFYYQFVREGIKICNKPNDK
jgi:hypothetical protein